MAAKPARNGAVAKVMVVCVLLVVAAIAVTSAQSAYSRQAVATAAPVAYSRASTRSPSEVRLPLLKVGEAAPGFAAELSHAADARPGQTVAGTMMVFPSTVRRLSLISVVDSDSVESASSVAVLSNIRDVLHTYATSSSFDPTPMLDAAVIDVGSHAVEAWHDRGSAAGLNQLQTAAKTSLSAGYQSDAGMTPTPHAVRDAYAGGVLPAVVLIGPQMRTIYIARGAAAANRDALMRAVGQAIVDARKEPSAQ